MCHTTHVLSNTCCILTYLYVGTTCAAYGSYICCAFGSSMVILLYFPIYFFVYLLSFLFITSDLVIFMANILVSKQDRFFRKASFLKKRLRFSKSHLGTNNCDKITSLVGKCRGWSSEWWAVTKEAGMYPPSYRDNKHKASFATCRLAGRRVRSTAPAHYAATPNTLSPCSTIV